MRDYGFSHQLQAHFLESPDRVAEQQAKFAWYKDSGALGSDFIFAHFIQTTPQIVREAAAGAASNALATHTPTAGSTRAVGRHRRLPRGRDEGRDGPR